MTIFVYLVLPELSPGVGILLLCGVFVFQICVDLVRTPNKFWGQNYGCCCRDTERNGYDTIALPRVRKWKIIGYFVCFVQVMLENKITKFFALLLQIGGIFGFIAIWVFHTKSLGYNMLRPMIAYPLVAFVLSFVWSNFFQDKIAEVHKNKTKEGVTARFKSSKFSRKCTIS